MLAFVWANAATDTTFDATFDAAAPTARAIVNRAIADWSATIVDFGYEAALLNNQLQLTISMADLPPGVRGGTSGIYYETTTGKPVAATITLDVDGAGAGGWYLDTDLDNNNEFETHTTPFRWSDREGTLPDLYRTILHEIGHAAGLGNYASPMGIGNFLTDSGVTDPTDGTSRLWILNYGGSDIDAVLTASGGGHLYEGPAISTRPDWPLYPDDLMNAGRTVPNQPTTRQFISPFDRAILDNCYDYTLAPATLTSGTLVIMGSELDDTITATTSGGNLTITLNGISVASYPSGAVKTLCIFGADGADQITVDPSVTAPAWLAGAAGNDTLSGGAGDDTLIGGAGADRLYGGTGSDTASYSASSANLTVSLDNVANDGAAGEGDNVGPDGSIENVTGGFGADSITGNTGANVLDGGAGNDTLKGSSGNDTLTGGTGADRLYGGTGNDTASYAASTANLTITLDNVANDGAAGETDNVGPDGTIENVTGGSGNDSITGNTGANVLDGRNGDDTLTGRAGNDCYLFGDSDSPQVDVIVEAAGQGTDTLSFASATVGALADLSNTAAMQIATMPGRTIRVGASGQAAAIENLEGGAGADTLIGSSAANVITGGDGDDTLIGGSGNDSIGGGEGNDSLTGGTGNDTLGGGAGDDTLAGDTGTNSIAAGDGYDTVDYSWSPTAITADFHGAQSADGLTRDTFAGGTYGMQQAFCPELERLVCTDYSDEINFQQFAGPGAFVPYWPQKHYLIDCGAGNDTLHGLSGDTVYGGDGDDIISIWRFEGQPLTVVYGGAGNDTIDASGVLYGDDGDDVFYIKNENIDTVDGGMGNDMAHINRAPSLYPDGDLLTSVETTLLNY